MKGLIKAFLFVQVFAIASCAFGWIDTGHMVVAAIAEKHLTPRAKFRAAEFLKIGGDALTNTFVTASCHSDDYKNDRDRVWHYINIHFRTDGRPVVNKQLDENVVWAIRTQSDILASERRSKSERAQALRYLIHFVGDVHQPMHAVARDSDAFPDGDRGGNDFKISPISGWSDRPLTNLHVLWDFGCGEFLPMDRPLDAATSKKLNQLAYSIVKEFPRSKVKNLSSKDPAAWADESFALAKRHAYALKENSSPSSQYLKQGQKICRERAAIAGYRLAMLINRILG